MAHINAAKKALNEVFDIPNAARHETGEDEPVYKLAAVTSRPQIPASIAPIQLADTVAK